MLNKTVKHAQNTRLDQQKAASYLLGRYVLQNGAIK
jgi:hypothetical protein